MLSHGMDAESAGYDVGYRSSSQFNREYSRQFGLPPMRDVEHLRAVPICIFEREIVPQHWRVHDYAAGWNGRPEFLAQ